MVSFPLNFFINTLNIPITSFPLILTDLKLEVLPLKLLINLVEVPLADILNNALSDISDYLFNSVEGFLFA